MFQFKSYCGKIVVCTENDNTP